MSVLASIGQAQAAIGRSVTRTQLIDAVGIDRFNAAVGVADASPLVHWAFFYDVVADGALGEDGHPLRGEFLPAIADLPRRMFAGSSIVFEAPLTVGTDAVATTRIADVRHRDGASGPLVFVDVDRAIEQRGVLRLRERQTLVYRPASSATPAGPLPPSDQAQPDAGEWCPGIVHLFRFSAATFNSHRIHYDRDYARQVEGYPDLVVQGPFVAARLAALSARRGVLRTFDFRAQAPCFVDRPIRLRESAPGTVQAIRDDDTTAMTAEATYA